MITRKRTFAEKERSPRIPNSSSANAESQADVVGKLTAGAVSRRLVVLFPFLRSERETVKPIGRDQYIIASSRMLFTARWSTLPDANTPRETNPTHEMLDTVYSITLSLPSTRCEKFLLFQSRKRTDVCAAELRERVFTSVTITARCTAELYNPYTTTILHGRLMIEFSSFKSDMFARFCHGFNWYSTSRRMQTAGKQAPVGSSAEESPSICLSFLMILRRGN